ncbi:MAG: MBL fold metallo-hydrolase [Dehalobacterium sp.]
MKISFCGGTGEFGVSCLLLRVNGKNLVIDPGIGIRSGKDYFPDFQMIQEKGGVDAILISHAQINHCGSLPILSREYPHAGIFMTYATKDLIHVLLYDWLKTIENSKQKNPVFNKTHLYNALSRIVCYSPQYTFYPFRDDLSVTFYKSGHVPGDIFLYLSSARGSILYSGDFSFFPQENKRRNSREMVGKKLRRYSRRRSSGIRAGF